MFVNSAFLESIYSSSFFFHDLHVFPLILAETLAEYPLIQLSFSYSFFFEAEIYKHEIFKNLPFPKISTHKVWFSFACKNKYI